jgi:hypothetical protein
MDKLTYCREKEIQGGGKRNRKQDGKKERYK